MNILRRRSEYFLTRWAALFIEALPEEIAWLIGRIIGWLTYVFDIRHRRVGARNLKRVYPELTPRQVRQHLRKVYDHLGKVMVEMIRTPRTFRQCVDRPSRNGSTLRINRYLTLMNPDRIVR